MRRNFASLDLQALSANSHSEAVAAAPSVENQDDDGDSEQAAINIALLNLTTDEDNCYFASDGSVGFPLEMVPTTPSEAAAAEDEGDYSPSPSRPRPTSPPSTVPMNKKITSGGGGGIGLPSIRPSTNEPVRRTAVAPPLVAGTSSSSSKLSMSAGARVIRSDGCVPSGPTPLVVPMARNAIQSV